MESLSVTIQMKPLLHYCHIMIFLFSAFYGMNLGKFRRILTLTNFGSEQGAISLWSNYL